MFCVVCLTVTSMHPLIEFDQIFFTRHVRIQRASAENFGLAPYLAVASSCNIPFPVFTLVLVFVLCFMKVSVPSSVISRKCFSNVAV